MYPLDFVEMANETVCFITDREQLSSMSQITEWRKCLKTLSKTKQRFHCLQDNMFKEDCFWWDEGQNLMIMYQEKYARYYSCKAVTEQNEGLWKRTHPSHCFNLDFSSHEVWWWGCAWRIIIFALPFKENRKLRKVRNFTGCFDMSWINSHIFS